MCDHVVSLGCSRYAFCLARWKYVIHRPWVCAAWWASLPHSDTLSFRTCLKSGSSVLTIRRLRSKTSRLPAPVCPRRAPPNYRFYELFRGVVPTNAVVYIYMSMLIMNNVCMYVRTFVLLQIHIISTYVQRMYVCSRYINERGPLRRVPHRSYAGEGAMLGSYF